MTKKITAGIIAAFIFALLPIRVSFAEHYFGSDVQKRIDALADQISRLQLSLKEKSPYFAPDPYWPYAETESCYYFYRDLGIGSSGADVAELQNLLMRRGYIVEDRPGFFGPSTARALMGYQLAYIGRSTGFLGRLTRQSLNSNCTVFIPHDKVNVPVLFAVSPDAAPAGAIITLNGSGFAPQGNTVVFDSMYIPGRPSYDGSAIQFTVPYELGCFAGDPGCLKRPIDPGTYPIYVLNSNGQSNSLMFEVTFGGFNSFAPPYPWSDRSLLY